MDLNKLKGKVPEAVINQLQAVVEKFEINTPLRMAHFLAQCSHESGNFSTVRENLNYSADGLKKIFPKKFQGKDVNQYARNPEKIGNLVYADRMGNGAETTGDGFRFRGRGYIQLTGKSNYEAFGKSINENVAADPESVATKYPLLSAAWFFKTRNINSVSDKGATTAVVTSVTKLVNGGTIGLDDRIKKFNEFYALLK